MTAPLLLVIDDSTLARAALRVTLEGQGYEVVEAEDGARGVQAAAEHAPDLILLDMEMPVMDGAEAMAALRDNPEFRDIPVLVLSSHTDVAAVTAALRAGALDYVTKPFEPTVLVARVSAALRTKATFDDLRRRNAELTAFAWRASHDLKSPLAAIRGMADTITAYEDRLDDETKRNLLTRISAAADQAAGLVEALLALARHAEQKDDGPAVTPDPEAVVRGLVGDLKLEDVELDLSGDWAPAAMPAFEFASVAQNLIDNASFYGRSPDGVLRLTVRSAVSPGGDMLELTVADGGRGVPPDAADRLFDPFFRGNDSRSFNPRSSGIGLAIVRRTLERWGGGVDLVRCDTGACFRMVVPVAAGEGEGGGP
jgi:signal transduction histidine kinase